MAGKQTAVLKTLVTDDAAEDFAKFARSRGYSSASDCLREIVLVAVYGEKHLTDLHAQRIASLGRNGSGIGTGAAG